MNKKSKEDREFAKRTNALLKEYEQGNFKSMPAKKFLKELEKL